MHASIPETCISKASRRCVLSCAGQATALPTVAGRKWNISRACLDLLSEHWWVSRKKKQGVALTPCVSLYVAFQLALLAKHCCSGTIFPLAAESRVLPSHILQVIILCVIVQVVGIFELHVADFAIR
jgi:hypothetical protein